MKRMLIVPSLEQATKMIKSFLAANALPVHNDLKVLFGWFSRNMEDDNVVGCPCFVCDCGQFTLSHVRTNNIVVYVKIFANKDLNVTKLYQITSDKCMFFDPIGDGETFEMKDVLQRYENQSFIYKEGRISEI